MYTQRTPTHSLVRVLLVTALFLAIPLVINLVVEDAAWSLFDYLFVGVLVMGTASLYELATKRPGSRTAALVATAIATVGGAAMVAGEVDDAPGLILLGMLMVVTSGVVGIRATVRGAGPADGTPGGAGTRGAAGPAGSA